MNCVAAFDSQIKMSVKKTTLVNKNVKILLVHTSALAEMDFLKVMAAQVALVSLFFS